MFPQYPNDVSNENISTHKNNIGIASNVRKSTKIHINPNFARDLLTDANIFKETPAHINPKFLKKHVPPKIHMNPQFLPLINSCSTPTLVVAPPAHQPIPEVQIVQANISSTANKYKLDKRPISQARPVATSTQDVYRMQRYKEKTPCSVNKTLQTIIINGVQYNSTGRKLQRKAIETNKTEGREQYSILQRFKLQRAMKNVVSTPAYRALQAKQIQLQQQLIRRNKDYVQSVKQRCLMMLRQRLVKSNIPCAIFQRLGKCRAFEIGRCNKVHNKKQVSTCKKFLRGECHAENCLMSHDATFAKMPVCRYFLQALCTRDNCPYLHKKLSDNATICLDFLRGFCPAADKCNKLHEFSKRTTSSSVKTTSMTKQTTAVNTFHRVLPANKEQVPKYNSIRQSPKSSVKPSNKIRKDTKETVSNERKRYFSDANISAENDRTSEEDNTHKKELYDDGEVENNSKGAVHKTRRPKIGDLPAYIPID